LDKRTLKKKGISWVIGVRVFVIIPFDFLVYLFLVKFDINDNIRC
jgi:hypothetical protein